jgi:hypothetical protein
VFFQQHLGENCNIDCSKGRLFVACAKGTRQCAGATAGGILKVALLGFGGVPETGGFGD